MSVDQLKQRLLETEVEAFPLSSILKTFIATALFQPNRFLGIFAGSVNEAKRVSEEVMALYLEIPNWLQQPVRCRMGNQLDFENGSKIVILHSPLHFKGRTFDAVVFCDSAWNNFTLEDFQCILPCLLNRSGMFKATT